MLLKPTYENVVEAAVRLAGQVIQTPVLTSRTVDEALGANIFFKCENFQRTGAFKFRGAFNALSCLTTQQRQVGVVTFSSGNHAQAIALSSRLLNIPCTILMPEDAPLNKVAATQGYGGNIIFYDRYTEDREVLGQNLAAEKGMALIPSYDHPHIIAGQGTATKELLEEVDNLDALFVCLGGGGLLAGAALATAALSPQTKIFGVEPVAGNDGQQSFRTGSIVRINTPKTIADGAQTQYLGNYTFGIIQQHVNDIFTATDQQLIDCMHFFATRMKIMVEPTGCLGFAAVKQMADQLKGQRIGVIVSGGNVDIARFCTLIHSTKD
jgi:threo-3-hydroxy-L-aspartate ammonia-lyase